ncbi:MAG: hypothetical protein HKN68_11645 [Saprospiraceae bacterium]|nr:hypothetical protein [Saprospiraceae bacterium]
MSSFTSPETSTLDENNGIEVVITKNVGFVLLTGSCGNIPEISSTWQRKDGETVMWTVLYQAPEGCSFVPEKGVRRFSVGFQENSGTLTVTPSGKMISKFTAARGF